MSSKTKRVFRNIWKIFTTIIISLLVFGWILNGLVEEEEGIPWNVIFVLIVGLFWGFIVGYFIGGDKRQQHLYIGWYKSAKCPFATNEFCPLHTQILKQGQV